MTPSCGQPKQGRQYFFSWGIDEQPRKATIKIYLIKVNFQSEVARLGKPGKELEFLARIFRLDRVADRKFTPFSLADRLELKALHTLEKGNYEGPRT
jgi:hypothetical protein